MDRRTVWAILIMMVIAIAPALLIKRSPPGAANAPPPVFRRRVSSPVLLPIPGTSSLAHLEENMAARKIQLSPEEWKTIDSLASQT